MGSSAGSLDQTSAKSESAASTQLLFGDTNHFGLSLRVEAELHVCNQHLHYSVCMPTS